MRVIGFTMLGVAILFIVSGIAGAIRGTRTTAEPARIHISELTHDQLDQNRHVIIEGVFISSVDALKYSSRLKSLTLIPAWEATDEFGASLKKWYEADGEMDAFPHPEKIPLIVKMRSEDTNLVMKLCEGTTVQGMLTPNVLTSSERAALGAIKKGFLPGECLVIEAGQAPPKPVNPVFIPAFGAVVAVIGLALVFVGRPKPRTPISPMGPTNPMGQMGRTPPAFPSQAPPPASHMPADSPNPYAPPPTPPRRT